MAEFDDDAELAELGEPGQMPGQLSVPMPEPATPKRGGRPVREPVLAVVDDGTDWVRAKRMYVEGVRRADAARGGSYTWWPSLAELAALLTIPVTRLRSYARGDDWLLARQAWQTRVEEKRQELRAEMIGRHSVAQDTSAVRGSSVGMALVFERLEEIATAQMRKRQGLADDDDFGATIDGRELETLARAMGAWHALGRKAMGVEDNMNVRLSGGVEVRASINAELLRDDPDRLFGFLLAAERSGLLGGEIVEAEIEGYPEIEAGTNFIPPRENLIHE